MKKFTLGCLMSLCVTACGGGGGDGGSAVNPIAIADRPITPAPWTTIELRASIDLPSIGIQPGFSNYQIVKTADLNQDGHDDLILTGQTLYPGLAPAGGAYTANVPFHKLPVLILYFNPQTGKFEPNARDDRPLMYTAPSVSVQDWNRDGLLDILIVGTGPDQGYSCGEPMTLLLNTAQGFRNRSDLLPAVSYRREMVIEIDLDQDGYKDLYLLDTGAQISPGTNTTKCPYRILPGLDKEIEIMGSNTGPIVQIPWYNPLSKYGQVMGAVVRDIDFDGLEDLVLSIYDHKINKSRLEIYRNRGRAFNQTMSNQFILAKVSDWSEENLMFGSLAFVNNKFRVLVTRPDYSNAYHAVFDGTSLVQVNKEYQGQFQDFGGCTEFRQWDLNGDNILDLECRNLVRYTSGLRMPRAWITTDKGLEAIDLKAIPTDHGQSFQSARFLGRRHFVYLGPYFGGSISLTIYSLK